MSRQHHILTLLLMTAAALASGSGTAVGENAKPTAPGAPPAQLSNEELLRNLQCMEQRLRALEGRLKTQGESGPPASAEVLRPLPARVVRIPETRADKDESKSTPNAPAESPARPDAKPAAGAFEESAKSDKLPGKPSAGAPGTPAASPEASTGKPVAAAPVGADPCAQRPKTASVTPAATPSGATVPAAPQQLLPPLAGGSGGPGVPAGTPATPGNKAILGLADSPIPGLSIGAYGEIKYGSIQNPAANGQWQNGFDAHRLVLLPTYAITPNIIFNAEIEFEHGGIAFDSDDKLHGSVDVEQIFVDFLIHDRFNWRAPGIDLVPIGYINQHHEPTQFYSVKRPELYNGLIPSTWRVPATSVFGTITDGIKYQLQVSSSLEDFGDDFGLRTEANTVPIIDPVTLLPIPYAAGITGLEALGLSRPVVGDFRQLSNDLAWAGKLDFTPPFLPGLGWSVSGYYSPNTTPRGAHDDFGNPLGRSSLTMFDVEFRYRIPKTWLELRAEYVRATFGNPINLRANNDLDPTNNVGKFMWGYSYEAALHIPLGTILGSEWKAVPFYRYTYQNFQTCGYAQPGGVAQADLCLQTGDGQMRFQDFGVAVFPSPKIVLKATYQRVRNNNPLGAQADSILGGVGFFF